MTTTTAMGPAVWGISPETPFLDITRPLDPNKVLPTVQPLTRTAERDTTGRIDSRRAVGMIRRYPRRHRAPMTADRALQIRAAAKLGESQRTIAHRFGIAQSTVSRLLGSDQ